MARILVADDHDARRGWSAASRKRAQVTKPPTATPRSSGSDHHFDVVLTTLGWEADGMDVPAPRPHPTTAVI